MNIIYAQQDLSEIEGKSIFLAGPTPRAKDVESWRPNALQILNNMGFKGTVLVPEMEGEWTNDFEYGDQIDWETKALEQCTVILFWIPRELPTMPAFTTNIEFGYWLAKEPKKVTLGFPKDAYKMNYIEYKAKEAFIECNHCLESTIVKTLHKIKYR